MMRENKLIAERLREAAALLEQQEANRFRVAAYRKAAETVESLPQDVSLIFRTEGFQGLTALPGIGTQIGGAIAEMIRTGQWTQLERLRGTLDPESLLSKVPGIGTNLARRILDELHIDTLEGLETAVYDGRLAKLPGFGARRIAMVRAALTEMLGRRRRSRVERHEPSIEILLDVDREYREKAIANKLRLIAPKRFNPSCNQLDRGAPSMASVQPIHGNATRAPHGWVGAGHGRRSRVKLPSAYKRVVRGRENECLSHYQTFWSQPPNVA